MDYINTRVFYESQERFNGATIGMTWLNGSDHSFETLDAIVQEASEFNDFEEQVDGDSEALYNDNLNSTMNFLVFCGGHPTSIQNFIDEECDDKGGRLASHINNSPSYMEVDDSMLMEDFIQGGNEVVEEAVKRVVRNGKVTTIKKPTKKRKMTAKQRMALAKARKKAWSGAAKQKRAKSNRVANR